MSVKNSDVGADVDDVLFGLDCAADEIELMLFVDTSDDVPADYGICEIDEDPQFVGPLEAQAEEGSAGKDV